MKSHQAVSDAVASVLTEDLLKPAWRAKARAAGNPLTGHCYAASEAAYHLLGGRASGWVPRVVGPSAWPRVLGAGETHWFLYRVSDGAVLDPTAGQFSGPVPYGSGKGCGFLTREPSRRAREIMRRVGTGEAAKIPARETPVGVAGQRANCHVGA